MLYTSKRGYRLLCDAADERGVEVRLGRSVRDSWMLQITVPPQTVGGAWRAAGFLFPDLTELDDHSTDLLTWLRKMDPLS